MTLAELIHSLRQLLGHAGYLLPGVDATSLDESLPVAYLCSEDVLNKLASFLNLWQHQRKIDLLTLTSPDDNAGPI